MNPQIKKQWCEVLRANDCIDPQGIKVYMFYQSSLRAGGQLSPDGLLTDLYLKAHGLDWEQKGSVWCALGSSSAMPDEVCEWAGLKAISKKIKPAVYDKDDNLVSAEERYEVEVYQRDPLLPSYSEFKTGLDKPVQIGAYSIPALSVIANDCRSYSMLADMIEKDL